MRKSAALLCFLVSALILVQPPEAKSQEGEGIVLCSVNANEYKSPHGPLFINAWKNMQDDVRAYADENGMKEAHVSVYVNLREIALYKAYKVGAGAFALYDRNISKRANGNVMGDSFWSLGIDIAHDCRIVKELPICKIEITDPKFKKFVVFKRCE